MKTLLLGWGNPDRQDDGAAWHVLEEVARRSGLPVPEEDGESFGPLGNELDLLFTLQLTPELAETFGVKSTEGVIITGVLQNGPAAVAGIRPGDVITSVAGTPVHNVSELLSGVAALKPGVPSKLGLQRQDKQLELDITPGVRPKPRRIQQ